MQILQGINLSAVYFQSLVKKLHKRYWNKHKAAKQKHSGCMSREEFTLFLTRLKAVSPESMNIDFSGGNFEGRDRLTSSVKSDMKF